MFALTHRTVAVLALAASGVNCSGARSDTARTPSPAELRDTLNAINDRELNALVQGDFAGAASFYATDAVILPPDGSAIHGRERIQAYWSTLAGSKISGLETQVVASGGDNRHAYLAGTYAMTVSPAGRSGGSRSRGTFLITFARDGMGAWKMVTDMWTAAPVSRQGP